MLPRETLRMLRASSRVFAAVLGAAVLAAGVGGAAVAVGRYGNDISWPQCGGAFPTKAGFGIVVVNGGRPFTQNPCLAAEWRGGPAEQGGAPPYMNMFKPRAAHPPPPRAP